MSQTFKLTIIHHTGPRAWDEMRVDGKLVSVPFVPREPREPIPPAQDWRPFGPSGPRVLVGFTHFPRIVHLYPDDDVEVVTENPVCNQHDSPWWFYHNIDDPPCATSDDAPSQAVGKPLELIA